MKQQVWTPLLSQVVLAIGELLEEREVRLAKDMVLDGIGDTETSLWIFCWLLTWSNLVQKFARLGLSQTQIEKLVRGKQDQRGERADAESGDQEVEARGEKSVQVQTGRKIRKRNEENISYPIYLQSSHI